MYKLSNDDGTADIDKEQWSLEEYYHARLLTVSQPIWPSYEGGHCHLNIVSIVISIVEKALDS